MKQIKTYEQYKDSGVEWIGKIPKDWKAKRIKDILKENITDGPHETPIFRDEGIPFLSVDSIEDGELTFENCRYISKKDHEEFKLKCAPRKDDILMGKAASTGKIARVKVDFEFSVWSPLALIRPNLRKMSSIFLEYLLKSDSIQHNIQLLCNVNTQSNIAMQDIPRINIPIPSLQEQQKIADYLDDKIKKIGLAISNKRKQMELLKEYEKVIVNEGVIRGLNKGVELKDSGIEWLGKIPKNWKVEKLKYIADLKFSNVNKKSEVGEKEVSACNYVDVYKNDYITNKLDFMKITASDEEINKFSIQKGDILATKDSEEPEDIAIPSFVLEDFKDVVCGYHLAMIRPSDKFVPKYLFRLFQSRDFNIRFTIFAKGVTRFGLDMNIFKDAKVPMPPLPEQQKIADYLDEKTSKIRKSIDIIEEEVEKLEEYKKILINEAVTGKIKVF